MSHSTQRPAQPRTGREHPYPCRSAARAASARPDPALGWWAACLLALASLLSIAWGFGAVSAAKAVRERFEYCERVRSGVMPDYLQRFQRDCRPQRLPPLV